MYISKSVVNTVVITIATVIMSGCTVMQSGAESVMEAPTLENQANRIVVGMGLIRTNTVIANMPISADATWPDELNDDLVFEDNKQIISDALDDDPYVATHVYTDLYQKVHLKKGYTFLSAPRIGTLTYSALNRAIILYGEDEESWPTFFDIETDLASFHKFKDGQLKQVEAISSNVYPTLTDAIISLMPINFQKDLQDARTEMIRAFLNVADLKAEQGGIQTRIDLNDDPVEDENGEIPEYLSEEEILDLKQKLLDMETEISQKEIEADEKELIYVSLLEEGSEALESDIELDDEQVALAKNIILASSSIKDGALEAGAAFALSTTFIATSNVVQDFPKELESLAIAKMRVPLDMWRLYDTRVARLAKNGLYALPAIAIGTYYAVKQAYLAGQYESIAEIIVEADRLQKESQRDRLIDEENSVKEEASTKEVTDEEAAVQNEENVEPSIKEDAS